MSNKKSKLNTYTVMISGDIKIEILADFFTVIEGILYFTLRDIETNKDLSDVALFPVGNIIGVTIKPTG